jgi:hypothetical protein
MRKDKKPKLPSTEDVELYNKAREKILEIFNYTFLTPERYKKFYQKYNLQELIPKVIGWIGICEICFAILQKNIKTVDLNKLNLDLSGVSEKSRKEISSCFETKQGQRCYLLGKRCRDVKHNGKRCRDILNETDKWHFLIKYLNNLPIRKTKRYCSIECRKIAQKRRWLKKHPRKRQDHNKKYYFETKLIEDGITAEQYETLKKVVRKRKK